MRVGNRYVLTGLVAGCIACLPPTVSSALTLGQVDTFEDGTTGNWLINLLGMGNPPAEALPANVASGGPDGADDNYLQLNSLGGQGGGSRLTAANATQWAGDYTSTGVGTLAVDLRNLGPTDLSIRFLLENPILGPPTDIATTDALFLPSGGGWTHAEFAIDAASLTMLSGDANTLLSNVTVLRVFHGPDAAFPGPVSLATLGIDNLAAQEGPTHPIPEPSTVSLVGLGIAGLIVSGRLRRRPPEGRPEGRR